MRLPAAVLGVLLAVQPSGIALAQTVSVAARAATQGVPVPVTAASLPLSATAGLPPSTLHNPGPIAPVTAPTIQLPQPLAFGQGRLAAAAVPAAAPAPAAPVAQALRAVARSEAVSPRAAPGPAPVAVPAAPRLAAAAARIGLRLRDAEAWRASAAPGGLPEPVEPPSRPAAGGRGSSRVAAFLERLAEPHARGALKPKAGEGETPEEKAAKEKLRASALKKVVGVGLAFAALEALGAWWTGSLALRADATHLTLDTAVSAGALLALWLSRRPPGPDGKRRFAKAEPVFGLLSSALIGLTAVELGGEVVGRLMAPVAVGGPLTIALAAGGLAANVINTLLLRRFRDDSLSLKGAFLHALTDAAGSVGIIVSGLLVYFFQWAWVDAAIGALIAALILNTAFSLARTSWRALKKQR